MQEEKEEFVLLTVKMVYDHIKQITYNRTADGVVVEDFVTIPNVLTNSRVLTVIPNDKSDKK